MPRPARNLGDAPGPRPDRSAPAERRNVNPDPGMLAPPAPRAPGPSTLPPSTPSRRRTRNRSRAGRPVLPVLARADGPPRNARGPG